MLPRDDTIGVYLDSEELALATQFRDTAWHNWILGPTLGKGSCHELPGLNEDGFAAFNADEVKRLDNFVGKAQGVHNERYSGVSGQHQSYVDSKDVTNRSTQSLLAMLEKQMEEEGRRSRCAREFRELLAETVKKSAQIIYGPSE